MLQFYINFLINYYDSMFYYLKYILLIFTKSNLTQDTFVHPPKKEKRKSNTTIVISILM